MKRYVTLEEISDGRLYGSNDMVKADCQGCQGCSACCQGMGESIVLDPYDIYRLTLGLGKSFEELLEEAFALNVVDGVILPHVRMGGEKEQCGFLNEEGRCGIYPFRPGICRLFPLGRYYTEDGFRYFLQTGECTKKRTKVKVGKWLETPQLKQYEQFIREWHFLIKQAGELVDRIIREDEETPRKLNLFLLHTFYLTPYSETTDFYRQFEERKGAAEVFLGELC